MPGHAMLCFATTTTTTTTTATTTAATTTTTRTTVRAQGKLREGVGAHFSSNVARPSPGHCPTIIGTSSRAYIDT
eukprot:7178535-Lingulodinium_polyedra.AAC.1